MVGLADDGLAVDGLLEVPAGGCGTRPTSTSRQDSYSSCGSFLSPSQYDGTASDMGSCYDIMEDEVSVSPQQTLPPENEMANCEMADLDVEMCEKKQVRLIKHLCRLDKIDFRKELFLIEHSFLASFSFSSIIYFLKKTGA